MIRRCSIPIETTSPIPLAQQSTQFTAVTQTTACLPRANTFWKSHPPRVQAPRPRPRPPIVSFSWRLESTRGARPKHQCNLFDCQRVILGCLKNPKKKQLNWKPNESFETGIEKTVKWYLNNIDWCKKVKNGNYQGERLGLLKS